MTGDRSSPERLLRELGNSPVPVATRTQLGGRRERVIKAMDRAFVAELAQRSMGRRIAAISMAAAILVLIGAGWLWATWPGNRQAVSVAGVIQGLQGTVDVTRSGIRRTLASTDSTALVRSDRVRTGETAVARVTLPSGAAVQIDPLSDVGFEGEPSASDFLHGERADLVLGRVDVQVPHLKRGMTFSVQTPNALVVVHGTHFSVEVLRPARDVVTNVDVTEGIVSVRYGGREIFLPAPARWSSASLNAALPEAEAQPDKMPKRVAPLPPSPTSTSVPVAQHAHVTRPATQPSAPLPEPISTSADLPAASVTEQVAPPPPDSNAAERESTLAEQNRLFAAAMSARKDGDDANTIMYLDALITRFPDSPLAQDARVERFRAQKRIENALPR